MMSHLLGTGINQFQKLKRKLPQLKVHYQLFHHSPFFQFCFSRMDFKNAKEFDFFTITWAKFIHWQREIKALRYTMQTSNTEAKAANPFIPSINSVKCLVHEQVQFFSPLKSDHFLSSRFCF